jgi:hypothetical protein
VEAGDVSGLGDAVLLEGAVDGVAGEKGFAAERLVWIVG